MLLDAVRLYRVYRRLDTLPLYIYYELLEKINPFIVIASFLGIKELVDQTNGSDIAGTESLVGKYQLDGGDAYHSFGRDRQYA